MTLRISDRIGYFDGSTGLWVGRSGLTAYAYPESNTVLLKDAVPVFRTIQQNISMPSVAQCGRASMTTDSDGAFDLYLPQDAEQYPAGTRWFIQPRDLTDYQIGSASLERLIVKSGAKLAILDTLGYFWVGDRNKDEHWKERVMVPFRALIARTGVSVLLVHHLSKGDDWKGRGTSAMFDDVDLFLHLEDPSGGVFEGSDMPCTLWVRKNKNGIDHFSFPLVYRKKLAIFEKEGLPS